MIKTMNAVDAFNIFASSILTFLICQMCVPIHAHEK